MTAWWMCSREPVASINRLALDAIRLLAGLDQALEPVLDRHRQEEGDVRVRKRSRPCRGHPTPAALVRERRVVVAVGDDDLARGESWADHLGDQLPARGHEQVHLGLRVELHGAGEHDLADSFAELVPARLSHQHRLPARERLAQELDLRGLAGPFGPFERDEQPAAQFTTRWGLRGRA